MTAKRKITDKNGVQVYPITHTKAVLDDNGNSVEQRLEEQMDVINQKQLEVGAVPSDTTPTYGSTNWVTSGGVFNVVNLLFEFNFDKYRMFYVSSNDNAIVNSSSFKSVIIENDSYSKIFLKDTKFNNTVPYAISFYSGWPSDECFISGVQSTGSTLADYDGDVPSECKYIVLSGIMTVTPTIECIKPVKVLDEQLKNIKVKRQMTDFDNLTLINSNSNSTSEKESDEKIAINSISTGGRSGFQWGNVLEDGKEYIIEFDITSDSTKEQLPIFFAHGTGNALFSTTVINNAHVKLPFKSVSTLDAIWFGTTEIGAGKTMFLSNIELYEMMSLTDYSFYVRERNSDVDTEFVRVDNRIDETNSHLLQILCSESSYNGDVIRGFVGKTSKEVSSNNAFATHIIENDGYVRIQASCGNKDANAYAIAFYSTENITEEGFISGATFVVGQNNYDLEIPQTAKIIVVSSRIYDTLYNYSLQYEIFGYYNTAKLDISILDNRVSAIENIVNAEGNDGKEYMYYGTRIELDKMSFLMTQLTSQGEVGTGQGFAYYGGYMFFAGNRGYVRIWKYSQFNPNLTFVSQYNLASYGVDNHANSLSFGNKYDDDDVFPSLYISECYGSQRCFVERVTLEGSTLLQTVSLNTASIYFGQYLDWVADVRRNRLLAVGVMPSSPTYQILEFELPSLNVSTVVLTESDILDSYTISNNYLFQGVCIYGDWLILPAGNDDNNGGTQHIRFFDLPKKTLVNTIKVSNEVGEPEDCDVVDGNLILYGSNSNGSVYKIEFI